MRREAVHRAGGLDLSFTGSCEDPEFFSRVARWGLGGFVDAPGMLYRVGATDQWTHPSRERIYALGFMCYLHRRLSNDRDRLDLDESVIRRTLAEAYAWVGEAELECGRGRPARYLWKSFRLNPRRKRALMFLLISLTPRPLLWAARSLKRRLRETYIWSLLRFIRRQLPN
jgi:hypothetical protein